MSFSLESCHHKINDAPCCCSALAGRTVLVLDSSQGIGKAIAVKAARDGANVLIVANTSAADPCKRDFEIHTAAKEGRCAQYNYTVATCMQ